MGIRTIGINQAIIRTKIGPDGSPYGLSATPVSDVRVDLSWTINSATHTGHEIWISTNNVTFTLKGSVLGAISTYSATGLTAGVLYYFKVRAVKGTMGSGYSNTANAMTYQPEVLLYVTGLVTPLSTTHVARLNTFVGSLKTNLGITNLSDVFDCLWLFMGETSESCLKNIVKNAHHCTAHGAAPPTRDLYQGFVSAGTTGYLNTNYNETQKVRYDYDGLNLMSGVFITNITYPNTGDVYGTRDWRYTCMVPDDNGAFAITWYYDHSPGSINTGNTRLGLPHMRSGGRIDANNATIRHKSIAVTQSHTAALAATTATVINYYVFGINNLGALAFPFPGRLGALYFSRFLSESEHTILWNALKTYYDSM